MVKGLLLFLSVFVTYYTNAQMHLSSAFGNGGVVNISIDEYNDPIAILQQPDSSLILLANVFNTDSVLHTQMVIVKTNNKGVVDSSFAVNGIAKFQFSGMANSTANAFVQLSDNSLMILGTGLSDSNTLFKPACLLKLNNDGSIDSSFGNSGTMYLQFSGVEEYPRVLKVNDNDELFIGGFSADTSDLHSDVPVIAKIDAYGNPDTTFGTNGKVYVQFPNGYVTASRHLIGGVLYDLLPLQDGSVLAAGGYSDINNLISFITRIKPDGNIDTAFIDTGYLAIDFTPLANSQVVKLVQAPNGVVWFGAVSNSEQTRDFYVGNLNLSTNDYNTSAIDFNGTQDDVADINLNSAGNLYITGRAALPQHNYNWYRSDYFAINYAPVTGFPFNNQQFTYTSDSTLQCGAVASILLNDETLLSYGFKNNNAGGSDLMLIALDVSHATAVTEIPNNELPLSIYPNPASGSVFINGITDESNIEIMDLSGRVLVNTTSATNVYLPLNNIAAGVYLLSVNSPLHTYTTKLVVK